MWDGNKPAFWDIKKFCIYATTVEGKIYRYNSAVDEIVEYIASPAGYTLHSICAWDTQCVVAGYNATTSTSILFLYNSDFDLISKHELHYQNSQLHTLYPLTVDSCQLLLAMPLSHPYTFTIFNVSAGKLQKARQLAKKGGIAKVKTVGGYRYVDKDNYGAVEIEKGVVVTYGEDFNVHRLEVKIEESTAVIQKTGVMNKFGCRLI